VIKLKEPKSVLMVQDALKAEAQRRCPGCTDNKNRIVPFTFDEYFGITYWYDMPNKSTGMVAEVHLTGCEHLYKDE